MLNDLHIEHLCAVHYMKYFNFWEEYCVLKYFMDTILFEILFYKKTLKIVNDCKLKMANDCKWAEKSQVIDTVLTFSLPRADYAGSGPTQPLQ